jgi:hypothetical protein
VIRCTSVVLALLTSATSAHAQYTSAAGVFRAGAEVYVKEGATAATQAWVKGSALEGNTQALSQSNMLRQIEDFYGKPVGFEFVAEHPVSPKVQMVYAVIHFAKGPLFCRFQAYEAAPKQWVATEFKFHTEATQVFPFSLLAPR